MALAQRIPLRLKCLFLLITTCLGMLALSIGLIAYVDFLQERRAVAREVSSLARSVAGRSTAVFALDNAPLAMENLNVLKGIPSVASAMIIGDNHRVIASLENQSMKAGDLPPIPNYSLCRYNRFFMQVIQPITNENRLLGGVVIHSDLHFLERQLKQKLVIGAAFMLLAVVVSIFLSGRLQRMMAAPVARLADEVGGLAAKQDSAARLEPVAKGDMARLVQAINDLMDTMQGKQSLLEDANKRWESQIGECNKELVTAREKITSADKLKSAFLANVSHELRAPLNAIIGFTGILLQGMVGDLNQEQRRQLGLVVDNARQLLDLINDVLDISRMEAGHLVLNQEKFDLSFSIDRILQAAMPLAEKKGLSLTLDLKEKRLELHNDRRRFEQVLLNLVHHAIKRTDQGSVVVSCFAYGKEARIQVTDSGLGTRPEDMQTIFRTFSTMDANSPRKPEWAGLGLSISRRLVERMGGKIWVENLPGAGSKFTFALPI